MMTSSEIRHSFFQFFKEKKHTTVPSSSLMPDSPNLLFTNAGMNQFVPIFLEKAPCPYNPRRVADTQKCIRAGGKHNDLDDVGFDTYHHTFFEMLGNWSFGDYFKKEAIDWAWELLVERWGLPPSRLYATIYNPAPGDPSERDAEAWEFWAEKFKKAGLDPALHIVHGSKKDNFWMMGETGPCGPCSEVHMDLTPEGNTQGEMVNKDSSDCIEIWNLVFIQFNANPDGTFSPLPSCHVDTGMGFERVASIIQGTKNFTDFSSKKISNYDTDIFRPIFDELEKISGQRYTSTLPSSPKGSESENEQVDIAFRVIADHIRTLTFSIADDIIPGNTDRNYVLRRILRRAVRYGRTIGFKKPFFYGLADVVINQMGEAFPELKKKREKIKEILKGEEEAFSKTLDRGIGLFEQEIERLKGEGDSTILQGDFVFELYDTYGFPLDLTQLMARELSMEVDGEGFEKRMEEQRQRARAAQKKTIISVSEGDDENLWGGRIPEFTGYSQWEGEGEVLEVREGNGADVLVLSNTTFYAEMGGQRGDSGELYFQDEVYRVIDTKKSKGGYSLHILDRKFSGKSGDGVCLRIDLKRREQIEAHHSATHIMHWALREVLGDGVSQKGSYVGQDRLRFDFSLSRAMTSEEVTKVEGLVQKKIEMEGSVQISERLYSEVKKDQSILQFFGDKYGEKVRVVDIGGYSKELCGGTHVDRTSQIGFFKILSEGGIAAGVRRIEAMSGKSLLPYIDLEIDKQEKRHQALCKKKTDTPSFAPLPSTSEPQTAWDHFKKRQSLLESWDVEVRQWEKEESKKREESWKTKAQEEAKKLCGEPSAAQEAMPFIVQKIEAPAPLSYLLVLVEVLKTNWKGVAFLISEDEGKVNMVASVSPPFSKKIPAGKIIQALAPIVDGKGGGRPELAQGRGSKVEGVEEALAQAEKFILKQKE